MVGAAVKSLAAYAQSFRWKGNSSQRTTTGFKGITLAILDRSQIRSENVANSCQCHM